MVVNCDEIEIIYFYHPDYLGSVEFTTDMRGEPYQFFLNTPWGDQAFKKSLLDFFSAGASLPRGPENQYAKSYTSFSSRFRFNGKEWEGQALRNKPVAYFSEGASLPRWQWDEETGNYYYGARYYDPKISVWLSVDPMSHYRPSLTPYNFVQNNPVMLTDPTGMLDICETCPDEPEFDKYRNSSENYTYNPDDGLVYTDKDQGAVLDEVTAVDQGSGSDGSGSSGSMGSGISIYGTGSNGVDNWNSGLNPLFSIDMTDPFWSAFFGWGQKEKYNDAIPGSDWSDDVKDMTKAVTDAVQVVDGMGGGGETPVAPVPDVPQPTNPDTTFQINVRGTDGWYRLKDTTMSKSNASGFLKDKEPGVTPNVYR